MLSGFNFKKILNFYNRRGLLALDMDDTGIRFVKTVQDKQKQFSVAQFFLYPLLEEKLEEKEIRALRDFVRANDFQDMDVATNIEDISLKIRRVEVPKMPDYDLIEAVKWELREVIEGPMEDYVFRYSPIEELTSGESSRLSLVAYAIHKRAIQGRFHWLKSLGLNPVIVEPNAVALLAGFNSFHQWVKGEHHGVLHLGWKRSLFIVVSQGRLFFSRPTEKISVEHCLTMLQEAVPLSKEKYDNIKSLCTQKGGDFVKSFGDSETVRSILGRCYQQFSLELQSSIDAFSVMFHVERVNSITLSGCGAFLPQLKEYFETNIGITARQWQVTMRGRRVFEGLDPYFSIALGLSLPQEYP